MDTLIIEIQYFAPVNLYYTLNKVKYCIFEQYESWQKMSFRNRCIITGAGGKVVLSIPLENGRTQKKMIRDVKIADDTNWRVQHRRSIETCYNSSPWFEFYKPELLELYSKPEKFLFDWNMKCFEWAKEKLKLKVETGLTDSYIKEYSSPGVIDLRGKLTPKLMEMNSPDFLKMEIKYSQVFEDRTGFIPHLSILDYLFCEGKF